MSTVSVTYKPPKGETKVCELFGFTFFEGKPVEIEENDANAHALKKLGNNPLFQVSGSAAAGEPGDQRSAAEEDEDDDEEGRKAKAKKGRW